MFRSHIPWHFCLNPSPELFFVKVTGHVGADESGCDGVHRDILAPDLLGKCLGGPDNARLGGRIIHLSWEAFQPGKRYDADDSAIPDLKLAPPDINHTAQAFYNYREQNFPNFYEEQDAYFELKKGEARRKYLKDHPKLAQYWDWRRDFFQRNPEVVPYLSDTFEFEYESEEERTAAYESQPNLSPQEWRAQLGTNMYNLIEDYANSGEELSPAALTQLENIAANLGLDVDELLEIIANSITD